MLFFLDFVVKFFVLCPFFIFLLMFLGYVVVFLCYVVVALCYVGAILCYVHHRFGTCVRSISDKEIAKQKAQTPRAALA